MSTKKKMLEAAAGAAGGEATYVEDVFSTYLYTGNGSTQTITNGIDLDGEGGLVWTKCRNIAQQHVLQDSERGLPYRLFSSLTNAQDGNGSISSFNNNGYTLSAPTAAQNDSGGNYASWTFRKAPKFFDVVTWTGDGTLNRTISHNLGVTPGCIITKKTNTTSDWVTYHRSLSSGYIIRLNTTAAQDNYPYRFDPAPSDTSFGVGSLSGAETLLNNNGDTYVAYLFAHNDGDGEFGESGDQDIIKCGSVTTDSSTGTIESVNLGWEPQWVLMKPSSAIGSWQIFDNMRGLTVNATSGAVALNADGSGVEYATTAIVPTATGFNYVGNTSGTWIYIAIRRGPMKTPTTGTSVFSPIVYAGNSSTQSLTGFGFPPDMSMLKSRNQGYPANVYDKLRGAPQQFVTPYTNAEFTQANSVTSFDQNGISLGAYSQTNTSAQMSGWNFLRAPGFFDVVCYTGTGVARTVAHNLGVAPELMIVKCRDNAGTNWRVYYYPNSGLILNGPNTGGTASPVLWNDTDPTDSVFSLGTNSDVNGSGYGGYVAYLFATLPGISKCGSYTGNGTSQNINCGFSAGARFVLIKRTDSTGDWHVWDTERGIVAGNDPFLELNTTNAENTSYDSVDPYSAGFTVNEDAGTAINTSGGSYIFLAIS